MCRLRSLLPFILGAFAGAWSAGCGSAPTAVAVRQQSLSVPACTEDAVSWPSGTTPDAQLCDGPWQLHKHQDPCYKMGDCGAVKYQHQHEDLPKTCPSPYFGVSKWGNYSDSPELDGRKVRTRQCVTARGGVAAPQAGCPVTWVCQDVPDCRQYAQTRADNEYNWISNYVPNPPRTQVLNAQASPGPKDCSITCSYTLFNYPLAFNQRADAQVCGTYPHDWDTPYYDQCRDPSHGVESDTSVCDPDAMPSYSSDGASRASLTGVQDFCDPVKDSRCPAPTCLTCEAIPASDVAGKLACLTGTYGAEYAGMGSADASALKQAAAKHLLQLLELHANELSPDQRRAIYTIALAQPDAHPGCGWGPPGVDAACSNQPALNGSLALCDRMSNDDGANPLLDTDAGANGAVWDRCVSAIDDIAQLSGGCRDAYLREYNRIFGALVKRAMGAYPSTASEQKRIQFGLQLVQRWYAAERDAIYPTGTARDALWQDVSAEVGVFWRQTHRNGISALDTSGGQTTDQLVSALTNAVRADLDADATVLNAALTPAGPDGKLAASDAPLLYVIANALEPMSDRLAEVGLFRDFGCRFNQNFLGRGHSCEVDRPKTQMVDLLSMLAALPDLSAMKTAYDESAFANPQDPAHASEWAPALDMLASPAGHQAFEQAVLAVLPADVVASLRPAGDYGPELITDVAPDRLPAPLVPLARLVADAARRYASYQSTGLFQAASGRILQMGIAHERQADVEKNVQDLYAALDRDTTDYRNDLQTLVTNLVSEINGKITADDINNRIALKAKEFFELSSDLEGLRLDEAADARHFGGFTAEFKDLVNSAAVDGNKQVELTDEDLMIGASQARFEPGVLSVSDTAVQAGDVAWTKAVARGDMLRVRVTGSWSPTCALQQGKLSPPADKLDPSTIAGSLTGPEGFLITTSGSAFKLGENRMDAAHETSQTMDMSLRVCAGAKAGFDEFGNAVWVSIEGCLGLDTASRDALSVGVSKAEGDEQRQSLALQSGLRVRGTPYEGLPLGSLLLVEAQPGPAGDTVKRVHVLQSGENGIVFDLPEGEQRDIYFVVNDRKGCHDPSGLSLGVHVTHLRPVLAQAQALGAAMADTLADVRGQTDTILKEGSFLPEKRTALRSAAFARLQGANGCNCDLSKFPPMLTAFFTSWLDSELAHIERMVAVQDLQRRRESVELELIGLHTDEKSVADEARLLHLLPEWSMKALQSQNAILRESTRGLLDGLLTDLYPVIHLRYPSTYDYMTSTAQGELDDLVELDWTASLYDLALLAKNAANGVLAAHKTAVERASNISMSEVLLRFPNPYYPAPKLPPDVPPPADPTGPKVDAVRAQAAWDGIRGDSGYATFTINPEDLYRVDGGSAVLVCREGMPSIRAMSVVVGLPASSGINVDPINTTPMYLHTVVSPQLRFATGTALESYTMANATWLPAKVRALAALPESALSTFEKYEINGGIGAGLSPFMSFNVDFNALKAMADHPLDKAKDVTVVMQVETTTLPSDITSANTCH
jgi:hypothetical protein